MIKLKQDKRKSKVGMPPGTPVFTGTRKMERIKISLIQYNKEIFSETEITDVREISELVEKFDGISWINVDGLHDVAVVEQLGNYLKLHKLTVEDLLSVRQRPKIDEESDYVFTVLRMFMCINAGKAIEDEQISFILKHKLLVTFQEDEHGDVFDPIRQLIRENKGQVRRRGVDYLLYSLIDAIIDGYFAILETLGDRIEDTESELLEKSDESVLGRLHAIRRQILHLRRSVYPLRELMHKFEKLEEPFMQPDTKIFVKDLYDHTVQVIETVEVFRDMVSGMLDLYMNSVSNKMNEVMKVLTVISTIFMPLTFIVGIYGMNFKYMPEIDWKWSYFTVMTGMGMLALAMLYYFKRKKWL